MSFDPKQFRQIIKATLLEFDKKLHSASAVELLMLTAAQESKLGTFLYQDDGDPEIEQHLAAGIFQIEPTTYYDIIERVVLPRCPSFPILKFVDLITDIKLSIVVARCKYWPIPEALPNANDIEGLARYYKRYYNTRKGKAKVQDAINNYRGLCF